jgi:hypothetical protein
MKYTPQQYEIAKKFREFYYKEVNQGDYLETGWWEKMGEDTWNRWTSLYQTGEGFLPQDKAAGDRARKLTDEFFKEKEVKTVKPSSYTFVSTDKDVDLLRIIREAPAGSPFILIEKRNRNNKTDTFLLVHEKVLNNPAVKNFPLYLGPGVQSNWGILRLGNFPGISLDGSGYRGHRIFNHPTHKLRAEIENIIKALNPKDTKTTVTVW